MTDPILRVDHVYCHFGGVRAVDGVSFNVREGALHAVIGPNGAGKTTLFNVIAGRYRPTAGRVLLRGEEISRLPQHEVVRRGIGRSYQITTLFRGLSVIDNVRLALQRDLGLRLRTDARRLARIEEEAYRILSAVGLESRAHVEAAHLSHGEQRHLDIAVALATRPRILLLDEPTAGMSPTETEAVVRLVRELNRELTVLLIEHKMNVVMTICDRITVLHFGRVLAEGTPDEVRRNRDVQEAYLGRAAAHA